MMRRTIDVMAIEVPCLEEVTTKQTSDSKGRQATIVTGLTQ